MPIYDFYSKRQKRLRGESPDVFSYDVIPQSLKAQIIHIINDAYGLSDSRSNSSNLANIFREFHDTIIREYGLFDLYPSATYQYAKIKSFFLERATTEQIIDIIEYLFSFLEQRSHQFKSHLGIHPVMTFSESIDELNERFKEHGIGYKYESGYIIRIDSEYIHTEAVKPALVLLHDVIYANANDEFLKAHEYYRLNHYEAAISEANKALESVLKIICTKQGWDFPLTATAQPLLMIVKEKGLFPSYLLSHFESLINTLKSGLPTMRNKNAGHGAGAEEREIPAYLASYALHLAATNIVFLIEAEKAL